MSIKQGGNTIAGAVGKYPLNERNISNCITNIPQDIKLELNNGTLTLKAGSKVYVPNGFESDGTTPKFDVVIIESDLAISGSATQQVFIFYSPMRLDDIHYDYLSFASICSGSTDSLAGVNPHIWYDTTNNLIKVFTDTSTTPARNVGFPFCLATSANNGFISIDLVFNGFGYIGSTVFALPGVKGLIPNGRNADGTLKNIEVTVNNVLTHTGSYNNHPQWVVIYRDSISSWDNVDWIGYNSQENILFNKNGSSSVTSGSKIAGCVCAFLSADANQKITNFVPKTVFHAVDYSDTEYIAHQAMPSSRHIDLTFAHGQSYIAPADGYFLLVGYVPNSSLANVGGIHNQSTGLGVMTTPSNMSGSASRWCLPVKKGESVIMYLYAGTATLCRFIYANGAQ